MDPISNIAIAILPILGVVIGASLQYFFSKSAENRKHLATLRTQAYIDYLRCLSESAHVGRDHPNSRKEILSKAADAKTRISIYGSSAVIEALTSFEKVGAFFKNSPQSEEEFFVLCNAMRRESIGKAEKIKPEDLRMILFGSEDWNQ